MKLYSRLFFVLTLISIGIIGCGDDPVTNNNNGNNPPNYTQDSLVLHMDSMVVYSFDSISVNSIDRFYQDSCQGFRLTFTGSTNADTSTVAVSVDSVGTNYFQWFKQGSAINGSFDLLIDTRGHYNGYFLSVTSILQSRFNNPPSKYIKLTDINIYRITYN